MVMLVHNPSTSAATMGGRRQETLGSLVEQLVCCIMWITTEDLTSNKVRSEDPHPSSSDGHMHTRANEHRYSVDAQTCAHTEIENK